MITLLLYNHHTILAIYKRNYLFSRANGFSFYFPLPNRTYNLNLMENFQLRDGSSRKLNNAFRNLSNNTCRSFISTAIGNESNNGQELRKSRIQNLPNYKKSSLGDNISFIVVFQTIEIERLSREVELLRMKIKENQRELFNAQNYQVQIRELTEKCFHYQQEKQIFTEQIEKLNRIAQNLYNQNESLKQRLEEIGFMQQQKDNAYKQKIQQYQQQAQRWKNRSNIIQRNKSKDLQELKSLMNTQRKSLLDRQMKQMSIKHQNQKSGLQNQIRKLRDLLQNKNGEADDLKRKNYKLQQKLANNNKLQQVIQSYENKLNQNHNDFVRLSQQIKSKDQQLLSIKQRQNSLNNKLRDQSKQQIDLKQLKNILDTKIKQLEQSKIRCSNLQQQLIKCKQMIHFINQLQDKLTFSTNQITRLNNAFKSMMDENERIKTKYIQKQNELSRLKNIQHQIAHSDAKFNMMRAENERVNAILKTRIEQIQNWKKKYNDLDAIKTRYSLLEKDKRNLQQRYNNQLKQGQQLKFIINKLQTENTQYKKFQRNYGQQTGKNTLLIKQIERLNNIIKNNLQDLTSSKMRYSKLQESLKSYKDKADYLHEYQNQMRLLKDQNIRLNDLIRGKNEDIESLESSRIDLVTKVNHYKNYQLRISQNQALLKKANEKIQGLKRDLENTQNKCRAYQNRMKQLQTTFNTTQQQKDKLNSINKTKINQLQDYKTKCSRLQQQCKKKAQLDLVCQQLHGQVLVYLGELEATERKYKEYQDAYNKQKKQNEDLVRKINIMGRDFEKINKQLNSRSSYNAKEIQNLQGALRDNIQKSKDKDQQIVKLIQKIQKLQRQCTRCMGEFQKLVVIVENNQRETSALKQKIEQYKDYAKRIHILGAQIDRITALNRGLEDDNKKMRLKYADNIDFQKKQQSIALMVTLMSVQIESLRERVQKKQINLDQMRRSILQPIRRI